MNKSILYIFLLSPLLLFYSGCKQEDEAMIEITEETTEVLYSNTSDYLYRHKVEIDGHQYGQMVHPTTNPQSLGKAYSNGCIGTKEVDAWYIYYYAPIGTNVEIRYDLEVVDSKGDTLLLKDIYSK